MRLISWKVLIITLFLCVSSAFGVSYGHANVSPDFVINEGTIIPIELATKISSKNTFVGEVFEFRVLDGVKVNGVTMIEAGARAYAKVVKAKSADIMSQGGTIELEPEYIVALDGTQVPIKSTIKRTQENRPVGVIPSGVLGAATSGHSGGIGGIVLFLDPFLGREAVLPIKTKFFVVTSQDVTISNLDSLFATSINWSGQWAINKGQLTINKSGDRIIGYLENGKKVLEGNINNNEVTGTWSDNLFNPVDDNGDFRFIMSHDGNHIKIYWYSKTAECWVTDITAKRIVK